MDITAKINELEQWLFYASETGMDTTELEEQISYYYELIEREEA